MNSFIWFSKTSYMHINPKTLMQHFDFLYHFPSAYYKFAKLSRNDIRLDWGK